MKKIFGLIKNYIRQFMPWIYALFITIILSGICTLITPVISGRFVDYLINYEDSRGIYFFCIAFAITSILNIGIGFLANRIYTRLNLRISFTMEQAYVRHMQKMNILYFSNKNISKITQQISTDIKTIVDFFFDFFSNASINLLKIIIPVLLIFNISKKLCILLLGLILIYFLAYMYFRNKLYLANYEVKNKENTYFGNLYEQLSKIKFLKIYSVVEWFNQIIKKSFSQLLKSALKLQVTQYIYSGLDTGIMFIGQLGLFLVGGEMVISKRMSIGEFTIINTYFGMGVTAVRYFFGLGKRKQEALVAYNRLQAIIEQEEEFEGKRIIESIYEIKAKGLGFSYGNKYVFSDINFKFEKGYSYAVIGKNGIGKTTLCNVITGLYKNYTGELMYNGISAKEYDFEKFRKNRILFIEQEPEMIEDTLYNNIVLDLNISKNIVQSIIKEWFDDVTFQNLDLKIGEKSNNLSGGEKEKIAIIRAIIRKPDVIIMDEPTAALDQSSCKKLENLLVNEWKDKIKIIITHDEKMIQLCDYKINL